MILVDKPYVSGFFRETVEEYGFSVVKTKGAKSLGFTDGPNILEEKEAVQRLKSSEDIQIYTTSENSIGWIARHLSFTNLPEKIDLFKNKLKFRTLLSPLYPDFYFKEVPWDALETLPIQDIPMPFVIKPVVGFFSMGVHKVTVPEEWDKIREVIKAEIHEVKNLYPNEVLNTTSFIIEQNIEGDEFAIDAYFDAAGDAVILNIYNHIFSSGEDVSDRVYFSSGEVVEGNLNEFTRFLNEVGKLSDVKDFPVHVEVRRTDEGVIIPIEINPMRFGGWCSTPDMTHLAYGFNPYVYYFHRKRPDWGQILKGKKGKRYSVIVLDNSTGVEGRKITAFDYDRLWSQFENPLELRKINYREYPLFGFLFTETAEKNISELERILKSNLREFVSVET